MASQYNVHEYDSEAERRKYPLVQMENLTSAALYFTGKLNSKNIASSLWGGLAVKVLGGTRDTRNVDIIFQARMEDVWKIVQTERRLIIPSTKPGGATVKIFVHTGPGYDDCELRVPVAVNLCESGISIPVFVALIPFIVLRYSNAM
ncbi:predicted protein [Uncinocarpus reesii 1704]|uniref:Uncharacterized protein n=1 Tax=Uncinocarpus reesii (strain UAMH 1704) TaxID=336963 RepID=C4JI62_UNCRE|nr:uncharacterized protein UREG_02808 [Uncinocarpus reesii 1704]EEP77959.1 predicted protein [Uncinocarpus reesii 1704]